MRVGVCVGLHSSMIWRSYSRLVERCQTPTMFSWSVLGMLKSFFLKNRLSFAKNRFFSIIKKDYRFWRHSDCWLLQHAGLPWGLMQLSRWVVERQAYKQTGHADWTDRLTHALARSVTCHGNIQSAAESGGGRETVACSKQHRLKRYLLDGGGGEGRTRVLSTNDLQSHGPPSRPTGQASRRPGHRSQRRGPTVKCQLRWGVSPYLSARLATAPC